MPITLCLSKAGRETFVERAQWKNVVALLRENGGCESGILWKYEALDPEDPPCPKSRTHALRWNALKRGGDIVRQFMVHLKQWNLEYQPCCKSYHRERQWEAGFKRRDPVGYYYHVQALYY